MTNDTPRHARAHLLDVLLTEHGTTFAQEAGIPLKDEPSPLYRLLVLAVLLSSRVPSSAGVAAARALAGAGLRTARAMRDSDVSQRVELLGEAGYRRFDERGATLLGSGAALLVERWSGDLRKLFAEADGDVPTLRRLLQEVPGIGPVGSAIFCREVQGVWPSVGPFLDSRVLDGASALGLPSSPSALARLVPAESLPRLAAACVRVTLDRRLAGAVKDEARRR
jgi:hypothetical protein